MEGDILNDKKNTLFNRREISFNVNSNICPSHLETSKFISEKLSVSEDFIEIKKITSTFGKQNFDIFAHVYSSKEDKENIEPKTKKQKAVASQ